MIRHITLHYIYYNFYFITLRSLGTLDQQNSNGQTSAVLSSSFNEKLEVDTLSEHFEPISGSLQGFFDFIHSHMGGFQRTILVFVLTGSQARFPFLLWTEVRNSSHKRKAN